MTTVLDAFGNYDFLVRESLLLCVVALGIYVLLHAGLFAVPQVGFMAIGGYTAAILDTRYGANSALTLVAALVMGALSGFLLGIVLARLDGIYLALASIGFSEIVRVTARNLDLTGGAVGIAGVERSTSDLHILIAMAVAVAFLLRLRQSKFGQAIEGIRQDPLIATHQGVNLRRYRLLLFLLSGVLSAGGGAMLVHLTGYIAPEHFSFPVLIKLLASTVLGGMASVVGPFVGGIVVFGLPAASTRLAEYRDLVNGVVIILVIAVVPSGLSGAVAGLVRRGVAAVRPGRGQSGDAIPFVTAEPDSMHVRVNGARASEARVPGNVVLLQVEDVSLAFGGVQALKSMSLHLYEAEVLGLIGPNGSGKTTFVNVLSGVYAPDEGDVRLDGESLRGCFGRPEQIRERGIARTFQGIRLVRGRSVLENVTLGAYLEKSPRFASALLGLPATRRQVAQVRDEAYDLLTELDLADLATHDVGSLPYGPQRRVEIARAMIAEPRLLMLDEPTAGMSLGERADIFDLIGEVRARGVTVVVVEHDVASISRACDRVAVLNFGQLIALGLPGATLGEEVVIDAYIGRRARR